MFTATLKSGKSFKIETGKTILDAASNSDILFPYSCKNGRCSTCKCRVIKGETKAVFQEQGLSEKEIEDGWILSCARTAQSDLLIDINDLDGIKLPKVKTLPCKVNQINYLTPNVVQVLLRFPPTSEFEFIPGQYIELIGAGGIRRSYSIANSDFTKKQIELHIRKVENGVMSKYWFNDAKSNDLLRVNGPLGTFFLRDIENRDLIFLATGTGIAPIKSILESLDSAYLEKKPRSMMVLWGNRHLEDFYLNEFKLPEKIIFKKVLSRPHEGWTGDFGYVQDVFVKSKYYDLDMASVYACGSDIMINSAKRSLVNLGLESGNFYSDAFVSSSIDN